MASRLIFRIAVTIFSKISLHYYRLYIKLDESDTKYNRTAQTSFDSTVFVPVIFTLIIFLVKLYFYTRGPAAVISPFMILVFFSLFFPVSFSLSQRPIVKIVEALDDVPRAEHATLS